MYDNICHNRYAIVPTLFKPDRRYFCEKFQVDLRTMLPLQVRYTNNKDFLSIHFNLVDTFYRCHKKPRDPINLEVLKLRTETKVQRNQWQVGIRIKILF